MINIETCSNIELTNYFNEQIRVLDKISAEILYRHSLLKRDAAEKGYISSEEFNNFKIDRNRGITK